MKNFLFCAVALIISSCGHKAEQTASTQMSAKSDTTVETTTGATATYVADSTMSADAVTGATAVAYKATFNGTIVVAPQNRATVTVAMDGVVKSVSLLAGEYVKRGTVCVTLENMEFISLQHSYLDAHAQSEYLETEYRRQQTLAQQEAASQKRMQQSKADYLSMKSRMEAAATQLALLGVDPTQLLAGGITPYIKVKAPIKGYVTDMKMNIGKHFAAGEPLFEIVNKQAPMLRLVAYEKDIDKVRAGDKVQFRVNGMGTQTFTATLVSIGQQVDDKNHSLELYARINGNNERFRPGMYVTARIVEK